MKRKLIIGAAAVFIIVVLGYTVSLKQALDKQIQLNNATRTATARPDTTLTEEIEVRKPVAGTVQDSVVRTVVGVDTRSPMEAGYEDGFWAGKDDKMAGKRKATYDDSSQFPTMPEREAYKKGYAEGYDYGFNLETTN